VKLALKNHPIPIYGEGDQTRSFCYIDDNVDTCLKTLVEDLFVNDVLNVGNDKEISILELAEKIIKLSDSKSEIIHLPALKEGDMKRRCPDISKMKAVLNRDLISIDQGIKAMINHYQNQ
jgi:UDP-glucose 4-epimerase